jgi:aminobenzoyl-glutamate utilization protein B
MTVVDILTQPKLVEDAWGYFNEVQTATTKYQPMIGPNDPPPTYLNKEIMSTYKKDLTPFYYNEKKYDSYLEQLGVSYPTLKQE